MRGTRVRRTPAEASPRSGRSHHPGPLGMLAALALMLFGAVGVPAQDDRPNATTQSDLVKQANAPISSIMQIRIQDTFVPEFWDVEGRGNTFSLAMTMPLPEYRLLPFPQ